MYTIAGHILLVSSFRPDNCHDDPPMTFMCFNIFQEDSHQGLYPTIGGNFTENSLFDGKNHGFRETHAISPMIITNE